jgi:hypothetical protein
MEILKSTDDLNIILNNEIHFQSDAGWEESLIAYEDELLKKVINPIENYETVRYIHKPYDSSGITQTDIWFYFYFIDNSDLYDNGLDYNLVGITSQENEHMLKQSTESFFRLEFYKTPGTVTDGALTCEPPSRINRKLVFAKNLALPLGEKYFYTTLNGYIHLPVFQGSNYKNKENMYFFWFADESVLTETNLSGSTTGNTFFVTAKFYNAKDGSILDFTNSGLTSNYMSSGFTESNDMYYQVDIDKRDYSYEIFSFNGTKGNRIGTTESSIKFYEKNSVISNVTPTPTNTPTPTPTPTATPTLDLTPNWQPYGDPYCNIVDNICTSKQVWKNMNPNNGGQTEVRNADTDVCDRNPNWVSQPISETFICLDSETTPGQKDKYIKQIDTNVCSSTYGAQRTKPGAPYETNSNDCYVNYYYNMISCSGGPSKVGKSNSALKQGTWVQVQASTALLSGCYLIPDVAPTNTDIPYDYDLDLLIMPPPSSCQAESCQLVIPYLSWNGYANNGDQDSHSEACNSNNPRTHVWTLYTYYTDTLSEGTFVYASASAAGSQDQNSPSSPGIFAYGGKWWEVVGGILTNQTSCGS